MPACRTGGAGQRRPPSPCGEGHTRPRHRTPNSKIGQGKEPNQSHTTSHDLWIKHGYLGCEEAPQRCQQARAPALVQRRPPSRKARGSTPHGGMDRNPDDHV